MIRPEAAMAKISSSLNQIALIITSIAFATLSAHAIAEEDPWYPSKWGADDQIGAANYMTPEMVVAAAGLVTQGRVYSLGIEVSRDTPAYPPRTFNIWVVQPGQQGGENANMSSTYNDDLIEGWMGVGPQIDGLGHLGIEGVFYNGNRYEDFAPITGLTKLGIETVPPLVTRGVLIDAAGHLGMDVMPEGTSIDAAMIQEIAAAEGIEIREGDVVLFHTGWIDLIGVDNERYGAGEPGINVDAARYLTDIGVVAIGSDSWGVEVQPFEEGSEAFFPVHQHLLAKNGTFILENMDTADLARDEVYEFLFVLGQPKFKGAVQAIINPIAIR